jgi:DNA-binding NtrC family response regulator
MRNGSNLRRSVLIVDDESSVRESLRMVLQDSFDLRLAANGAEALTIFQSHAVDAVLLDIILPDINGIELLGRLKEIDPEAPMVMVTAVKDLESGVAAMKGGAIDYLVKPFDVAQVQNIVQRAVAQRETRRELAYLRSELGRCRPFEDMIGQDSGMRRVFELIETVAASDGTVLIQGESGTGKELVARAIHKKSPRQSNPYVVINCAAIPATLMESELFGHRRGAFTGADFERTGKLEIAHTGTVFLDDIDSLSLTMQAKLLRVIQQKEFERIGCHRLIKADIRFIAASNRDLRQLAEENAFRADLFYRLHVLPIELPPLRRRKGDIPQLLEHFLKRTAPGRSDPPKRLTPSALALLMDYDWPGNVRELENLVERLCTIHKGTVIRRADIPMPRAVEGVYSLKTLKTATQAFERQYIIDALEACGGNRSEAARRLGIHRNTLLAKSKDLKIASA